MKKNISTLQCAFDYLTESGEDKSFNDIWNYVVKTLEIEDPDSKIGSFYTSLTFDGRFFLCKGGKWGLSANVRLEDRIIDLKDFYQEEETTDSASSEENSEGDDYSDKDDNSDSEYDASGSQMDY